jgi:RNA polymerase sigma-70 factor (ECF subfamily)
MEQSSSRMDFRSVFEGNARYVWNVLRHLGVRERDIEDVCQEVFLVVHRNLDRFDGRSSVRTWIYAICIRTASDYRRRAHVRREEVTDAPPDESELPTQLDHVERSQARQLLESALDKLDEEKRAAFVLYEIEELTLKEVAEAIGCPLATAHARLQAARRSVEATFRRTHLGGWQHEAR